MNQTKKILSAYLSLALVISLFAWTIGFGVSIKSASAENLTSVSDVLSNSDLDAVATHTISWTNGSTTLAGQTVKITFDPDSDGFDAIDTVAASDLSMTGDASVVANVGACSGANQYYFTSASASAGDESITLTACSGDVAAGSVSLTIAPKIVNPGTTGSYIIRLQSGTMSRTDTRIAIIDNVVVTAAVDTTFSFQINGVSSTEALTNGASSTYDSTATSMDFGTLPINTPVTMAQELHVATNARNGFVVTVTEDQNLLSSTGADIDQFIDGASTTVPVGWQGPANTLDSEETYGHWGLTSDDSDLNSGEFGTSTPLWAGNFDTTNVPRQIFSHNGPSDGTTQDKGTARVAYRIQIGPLQEAGNDYTNTLTYVATPTF